MTWVVKGHGFGHGVGMSQWGAYGFAKRGRSHGAILRHYYRGARLGKVAGPRVVRVLVHIDGGNVSFSGAHSACGRRLDPRRGYQASRRGSSVRLLGASGRAMAGCGRRLRASGGGRVRVAGVGAYRGALEVVPTRSNAGSLNAVNAVPVNQYVKGVIAGESPASWPMAALRAQAVAARSYALSTGVGGNGFDHYDDTRSQVYEGIAGETARTNRAANQTASRVMKYRRAIAQTYFSACSGGHTESVQNVFFGEPVPYLRGVPDPFDFHCPLHNWTLRFSGAAISAKLGSLLRGRLQRVVVTRRGVSPRIVRARLVGTGGTTTVRGDSLQYALGGYDRWMRFIKLVNGKRVADSGGGAAGGGGGKPKGNSGGTTSGIVVP